MRSIDRSGGVYSVKLGGGQPGYGMATQSATRVKGRQRNQWDAVADGWAARSDWTEQAFQPLTTWFQEIASQPAHPRILDAASGTGYPALAMARAVRPGGRVVASDVSARMIALAAERARRETLDNIEFVQMDAEALAFQDSSFDIVTNACGLMFCLESAPCSFGGASIACARRDHRRRHLGSANDKSVLHGDT